MNIQPVKSENVVVPAKAKATAQAAQQAPPADTDGMPDAALVERKRQLLEKLGTLDDTRPEKVAQAEAIVADTTYPAHELMARLARVMTGA